MSIATERQQFVIADVIRVWWDAHRVWLLRASMVVLTSFAAVKIGDEFRRLLFQNDPMGPIDLANFQRMVGTWFSGKPFYSSLYIAVYPPASLPLLWPLTAWLDFSTARWLWAALFVGALVGFSLLIINASGAETKLERTIAALMLLSMNATGVTIGNGQLILFILPPVLIALTLLKNNPRDVRMQVFASGLILFTLVKPSITIPFLLLVLFIPQTLFSGLIIAIGYSALTLYAATFQSSNLWDLFSNWLARASAAGANLGYANLTLWAANLGLDAWGLVASAIAFAVFGIWVYINRREDLWLLLGVTGIFARLWVFHSVYDDVLIVLPMVALYRIAKQAAENSRAVVAGVLLTITITAMLFPARWQLFPAPWYWIFIGGHVIIWLLDLIFLITYAQHGKNLVTLRGTVHDRGC